METAAGKFKAFRLTEADKKIRAEFVECTLDDLDPGDVVVRVAYSDVNYKDALAATGKGRILRRASCIGGIDFSGTVVSSTDARFAKGDAIYLHEFFYALMQGYDAVAQDTDVQVGGTDQLFNLLAGRVLQRAFDQRPQIAVTLPILVGTDGHIRMSKSMGNAIGINEPPDQMYGKVMSIPDSAIVDYFRLVTRYTPDQITALQAKLAGGAHPRDVKMELAREIVSIFHGATAAQEAEAQFVAVFQQHDLPEEMPEYSLTGNPNIVDLLSEAGLIQTKSEGRRLIQQGGVKLDGKPVSDIEARVEVTHEAVLQIGRRKFIRLIGGQS